jgi:hypothetical protein
MIGKPLCVLHYILAGFVKRTHIFFFLVSTRLRMYTGISSEGINREVVATLECTSLNKQNKKMSLAIPKTAILHIAKTLEANLSLGRSSTEAEADMEKIKGILPALRHMVDLDSRVLENQTGVIQSSIPISSQDIESTELDPYASYFCKLCHTDLFNSFMHCNGCECLMGKDFNLCIPCHQEGTFERFHQMHNVATVDDRVSTMNHTGKMASTCRCKRKSQCFKCGKCPHCSCQCHCEFIYKRRFYTNDDLKEILRALEESVKGSELQYCEETQVRLKLTADREDVEALEAKRDLLDRLRKKSSDLAATGETKANASADADADRGQRKRRKLDQLCPQAPGSSEPATQVQVQMQTLRTQTETAGSWMLNMPAATAMSENIATSPTT